MRRQAIRLLGERVSKRSFDFLSATAQSTDGNAEVQVQAVRAISERKAEESVPLLIKIARRIRIRSCASRRFDRWVNQAIRGRSNSSGKC